MEKGSYEFRLVYFSRVRHLPRRDVVQRKVPKGDRQISCSPLRYEAKEQARQEAIMAALVTEKQAEILGLLCNGMHDKEVALHLGISYQTVKNHVSNVIQNLEATTRVHAIALALRKGLIQL